jgi:hypothetical protein
MYLMDEGIEIDVSDEQFENASSSRSETLQPGSNDNFDRFVQSRKHEQGII